MTVLMGLSGHPLVHALGWTLLHFVWQGAAVAGLLWCGLALFSGRSSQARYAASCFALVLLVALPIITCARIAAADYRMRSEVAGAASLIDPSLLLQVTAGDLAQSWTVRTAVALDHALPWLLTAWFAGVVFFVARLNFGLLVARRLKYAGTETPPDELLHAFEVLRVRLGVARAVHLLHSARVQVPTVIGWLRPVILIPASCLTGLSTEQIEAIFCHELAHVRRHDYLVSVFQSVIETLLFYHPAVWWVSKQVRRERECCCDDVALTLGGDVLAYAKALSYLEERRASFPEFVLGANGGVLTMRIKRILGFKENTAASQFAALTVLAALLAIAGSYVVATARAQSRMAHAAIPAVDPQTHAEVASVITPARAADLAREEDSAAASPQAQSLPPAYSQWVSQDVAYIITPEERAQFLTLTSNEQRDAFIENFWARRNPAGAAPNSFREEHYARVAYANQHFADGRPGWQTSRGRTYIVLGKPYAIDSHPGGDPVTRTAPFEVWRYQTAGAAGQQVDIKFVADGPFGRYRLVSPDSAPAAVLRPSPPVSASNLPAQVRPASTSSPVLSRVALSKTHPADDSAANYNPPADALPAHATADPVRVAGSVAAGMVISRINPIYPEEAKAAGVQGSVILKAVVSKAGTVDSLQVVSGPPALTTSAIDAVKRWKYSPYLLNGQPTDVQTTIAVNYTLDDAGRSNGPGSQDTAADLTPRKIGGNVSAPMVIYQVDPEYTPEARNARFGGVVLVNLVVDQQGVPQNVHVLRSLGMGLDAKALEAVKQYRFRPAMEDGKPVPVQLNIEVNFQIFRDPDASSSTAAPFHLRMSTPVLVARLEPLAFPFPQTLALKPILLQMAQQNSAGLYVARAQAAPAQSQALPELATPQYGLTDEQRKQLESNLDAAKRATAEAARRLNSPEFRKQMENAERPAADAKTRLNSPEFRKQMEDAKRQAMEAANRINTPEFHQQMEEAQKRALAAAKELNSADLRRMLDNARFQLDLHQSGVDTSEFHKEMEDIRRQISAAAEELREARDLANPPEKK